MPFDSRNFHRESRLHHSIEELLKSLKARLDPEYFEDEKGRKLRLSEMSWQRALEKKPILEGNIFSEGLPQFLAMYREFLPNKSQLSQRSFDESLKCASEHLATIVYTAGHLNIQFSLTAVASRVYDADRAKHTSYRKRVRKIIAPKLARVGIWETKEPGDRMLISAGSGLIHFMKLFYFPCAQRQTAFFAKIVDRASTDANTKWRPFSEADAS